MTEITHFEDNCHHCGERYEADTERSPKFTALYCSQGCATLGGWIDEDSNEKSDEFALVNEAHEVRENIKDKFSGD